MKLLTIQPGASYSTADVYDGLVREWQMLGHEIVRYNLDARISRADSWLKFNYEKALAEGFKVDHPTINDTTYLASAEAVLVALRHMPDWVVIVSGMYFHQDAMIMMKRARQRVALIMTESPYDDEPQRRVLPYADVVFTNDKYSAEAFGRLHRRVFYLPHAHDPSKHLVTNDEDDSVPAHDVVFVGTGFRERMELLAQIDWEGVDLGLYGSYELLEDMPDAHAVLQPYIKGSIVENRRTASLYRKAKIGLNFHRTSMGFGLEVGHITRAYSLNPRMYELAANGCFMISDYRPEIDEVFGDLVPTFSDAREAEALIRRWLKDEDGRKAVSSRLPDAVAQHTYTARAVQVSRTLMDEGAQEWHGITDAKASSTSQLQDRGQQAPLSPSTPGR